MEKQYTVKEFLKESVDRVGSGYGMGVLIGSASYFVQGAFYAPRRQRLIGGVKLARDKAPLFGGQLAVWCGCYMFSSGLIRMYRGIDDKWNAVVGATLTGFLLTIRSYGFHYAIT